MPRTYTPVPGHTYGNYTQEALEAALHAVNNANMTISAAAKQFEVPRKTLSDKLSGSHPRKTGGQPVFSAAEEHEIANTVQVAADWGFPMSAIDLRLLIKSILDTKGIQERRFKANTPGIDFVKSFARRNNMVFRVARNIKGARAKISPQDIHAYLAKVEPLIENVPPSNIFNYDETNITDNPGAKVILTRRGTRRIENIKDHSKIAISLMVCGAADGTMLSPMVVYKAKNIYENWKKGGPRGTVYDCTASGWFDMQTFERWFTSLFLPHANQLPGKKVLLGDNLASHFSPKVIRLCREHQIHFISLIPNATHLLQPLDVAVFKGLKVRWRRILDKWRMESQRKGVIPKEIFPQLLNSLWDQSSQAFHESLQSGFRACGYVPFRPEEVTKRLPDPGNPSIGRELDSALIELLKERRGETTTTRPKRGKKVSHHEPGVDLAAEAFHGHGAADAAAGPSTSTSAARNPEVDSPDENTDICFQCGTNYRGYTGPDWVQCLNCIQWFCGKCNQATDDPFYVCQGCNGDI